MSCLLKGMIVPLIPLRLHQFRQFYGGGRISTTALDYDEKSAIITKLYTIEAQIRNQVKLEYHTINVENQKLPL